MTPEESEEYSEHLLTCQVCLGLVGEFQGAARLLPDSLAIEPASPDLKRRILAQAGADVDRRTARVPSPPASHRPSLLNWLWPARVSPIPAVAIAVLAMAVVGLMTWNITLQWGISELDESLLQHQEVIRSIAAGGQVHQVPGTDAAPQAAAVLVQNPGMEDSVLIVTGLDSLPSGMEYQVWRIAGEDAAPEGAGTFRVIDTGAHLVPISTTFSASESIGVSVEPAGGSLTPTGNIVLLGKL